MFTRSSWTLSLAAILFLGSIGAGSASAQPAHLNTERDAALTETILALTEAYNAAWEELSAEKILRFHPEDVRYYYRGTADISSKTVFEHILREEILPSMQSWSMEMIDPHVRVLGPDAAVVSFAFDTDVIGVSGQPYDYGAGALTYVFERRAGEWKIVLLHESAFVPEKE